MDKTFKDGYKHTTRACQLRSEHAKHGPCDGVHPENAGEPRSYLSLNILIEEKKKQKQLEWEARQVSKRAKRSTVIFNNVNGNMNYYWEALAQEERHGFFVGSL